MATIKTESGAAVDLKALVDFSAKLEDFRKAFSQSFEKTDDALSKVKQQWDDDKRIEFENSFKKYKDALSPLAKAMENYKYHIDTEYIPRIEAYLKKEVKL